jgi:ATP/ADP translocase
MNLLLNRKKGVVLLQTVIVVVLLAMIAVMVIKWTMSRYTLVNHVAESVTNTANAQGEDAKKQMALGMQNMRTTPEKYVTTIVKN